MAIVELDQDVRRTLAGHLSGVAWPTVVIALVSMAAFVAVALLGFYGPLPLWLGYLLNTSILYVIFTPLHEAAHGNIAGRDKQWIWLNNLIGHGAGVLMLYEFNIYKHMHMQHHRNTNAMADEIVQPYPPPVPAGDVAMRGLMQRRENDIENTRIEEITQP